MEIFIYYILPNIVLFGGIYVVFKYVERITWYCIENHNLIKNMRDWFTS